MADTIAGSYLDSIKSRADIADTELKTSILKDKYESGKKEQADLAELYAKTKEPTPTDTSGVAPPPAPTGPGILSQQEPGGWEQGKPVMGPSGATTPSMKSHIDGAKQEGAKVNSIQQQVATNAKTAEYYNKMGKPQVANEYLDKNNELQKSLFESQTKQFDFQQKMSDQFSSDANAYLNVADAADPVIESQARDRLLSQARDLGVIPPERIMELYSMPKEEFKAQMQQQRDQAMTVKEQIEAKRNDLKVANQAKRDERKADLTQEANQLKSQIANFNMNFKVTRETAKEMDGKFNKQLDLLKAKRNEIERDLQNGVEGAAQNLQAVDGEIAATQGKYDAFTAKSAKDLKDTVVTPTKDGAPAKSPTALPVADERAKAQKYIADHPELKDKIEAIFKKNHPNEDLYAEGDTIPKENAKTDEPTNKEMISAIKTRMNEIKRDLDPKFARKQNTQEAIRTAERRLGYIKEFFTGEKATKESKAELKKLEEELKRLQELENKPKE